MKFHKMESAQKSMLKLVDFAYGGKIFMLVNNCLEFILESAKHTVALFGIVNTLPAACVLPEVPPQLRAGVCALADRTHELLLYSHRQTHNLVIEYNLN